MWAAKRPASATQTCGLEIRQPLRQRSRKGNATLVVNPREPAPLIGDPSLTVTAAQRYGDSNDRSAGLFWLRPFGRRP
jgi:hypothetical protein